MPAWFVTGTGTGVGKTYVTCGLIRHLKEKGHAVAALKPIVSGFDRAAAADSDCGQLLAALDRTLTDAALDEVSPWRFAAPLSPDMAAARENRAVPFNAVVAQGRAAIARAGNH